jgi:tetratricopeptide (TPR) repeat protein
MPTEMPPAECARAIRGAPGDNFDAVESLLLVRLRALARHPAAAQRAWLASTKARALIASASGKTAQAIQLFERARAEIAFTDPDIEASLSELRAIRRLERRLELHPNDVRSLVGLAQAYYIQERDDASLDCLHRALRVAPDCAEAHSLLAAQLHSMGDYDAAVAEYRAALRLSPVDRRSAHYLPLALQRTLPTGLPTGPLSAHRA